MDARTKAVCEGRSKFGGAGSRGPQALCLGGAFSGCVAMSQVRHQEVCHGLHRQCQLPELASSCYIFILAYTGPISGPGGFWTIQKQVLRVTDSTHTHSKTFRAVHVAERLRHDSKQRCVSHLCYHVLGLVEA